MKRRAAVDGTSTSSSESEDESKKTASLPKRTKKKTAEEIKQVCVKDKKVKQAEVKTNKKSGGKSTKTTGPKEGVRAATNEMRSRSLRRTTVTRTRSLSRIRRVTRAGVVEEKEVLKEEETETHEDSS